MEGRREGTVFWVKTLTLTLIAVTTSFFFHFGTTFAYQSYKAHKNGIKKPGKHRHTSTKGVWFLSVLNFWLLREERRGGAGGGWVLLLAGRRSGRRRGFAAFWGGRAFQRAWWWGVGDVGGDGRWFPARAATGTTLQWPTTMGIATRMLGGKKKNRLNRTVRPVHRLDRQVASGIVNSITSLVQFVEPDWNGDQSAVWPDRPVRFLKSCNIASTKRLYDFGKAIKSIIAWSLSSILTFTFSRSLIILLNSPFSLQWIFPLPS